MLFEKTKIYGVNGVGGENPQLTRTDDATGLKYYKGKQEIESDFSLCYPWGMIHDVTDEFGNVFVKIPKFYSRVTKNPNGTYKYQISGIRYEGFSTLFIDGKGNEIPYVLIGKYEGSGSKSRIYSKSGKNVLGSILISGARNACRANGEGYQQFDFLLDGIIKHLFLVEFATTNCQSIMAGWTSGTAALITGHTDSVKTASGSCNTNHDVLCDNIHGDGLHACKYRGIENPWGNACIWIDGINIREEKIFICTDPTSYQSGIYTPPYFYVGDRVRKDGFVRTVTQFEKMPLIGYISEVIGMAGDGEQYYYDKYYCDYTFHKPSNGTTIFTGGHWTENGRIGLWFWNSMNNHATGNNTYIGARLCYKPIKT